MNSAIAQCKTRAFANFALFRSVRDFVLDGGLIVRIFSYNGDLVDESPLQFVGATIDYKRIHLHMPIVDVDATGQIAYAARDEDFLFQNSQRRFLRGCDGLKMDTDYVEFQPVFDVGRWIRAAGSSTGRMLGMLVLYNPSTDASLELGHVAQSPQRNGNVEYFKEVIPL